MYVIIAVLIPTVKTIYLLLLSLIANTGMASEGRPFNVYYNPGGGGGGGGGFSGHPGAPYGGPGYFNGHSSAQARQNQAKAKPAQCPEGKCGVCGADLPVRKPYVHRPGIYKNLPVLNSVAERDDYLASLTPRHRLDDAPNLLNQYITQTNPRHHGEIRSMFAKQYQYMTTVTRGPDPGIIQDTRGVAAVLSFGEFGYAVDLSKRSVSLGEDVEEDFQAHMRLSDELLSVAMGLNPVVAIGSSAYEFITGRNIITGARLDNIDRSFALAGVMTLGIANRLPSLAKLAIRTARFVHSYDRSMHAIGDNLPAVQAHAERISEGSDMLRILREPAGLLRHEQVPLARRREVIEAFTRNARVRTLAEDFPVRRYWIEGEGGSLPRGRWVVPRNQIVDDPLVDLALWREGPYRMQNWTIPRGTRIIEGTAGPNFGQPGGAFQIYVPDPGVLF